MIIDTTISFQEKRICMAKQLAVAVERKRAKKNVKQYHDNAKKYVQEKEEQASVKVQKSFARLVASPKNFELLLLYLKKVRANCYNQTVVELSAL